jgi:hypothetical protein
LPDTCRDYGLWALSRRDVGTKQNDFGLLTVRAEAESDGRAGMPEPDLRSVDSMPVGALAFLKQEVDRSNGGTCARLGRGTEGLCVPASLGMRHHAESPDEDLRIGFEIKRHEARVIPLAYVDGIVRFAVAKYAGVSVALYIVRIAYGVCIRLYPCLAWQEDRVRIRVSPCG